jgi:uncharacterized protein YbjT (DUF2867 family)
MPYRLICDTNVWYNAAHDQVSLADLTKGGDVLCISPLTILEFFATLNVGNFTHRKRAAELTIMHRALVLPNTDIQAAVLVGMKPVVDETRWNDALHALAQAADIDQLQGGVPDTAANLERGVAPAVAEAWLLAHRTKWVTDHNLSLMRTGAIGATADSAPIVPKLPAEIRKKLESFFASPSWHSQVVEALRAKAAMSWFLDYGQWLDLAQYPVPPTALSSTQVFATVYGRYHYAMRVEGLRPQPNDSEDVEYFLYLNHAEDRIVTSDKRWHVRAKDAGVAAYLINPMEPRAFLFIKSMKIKPIITGATGMVGEGVLLECLSDPDVERVLVINRKPGGVSHPKLREIIHADFFDLSAIEPELVGYDACFFCLGVSSVGMGSEEYRHITYDLTLNFAGVLARLNPQMTFCYVTGMGTDSSEKGRVAWARVKGATENALMRLFKKSFMFRPGFMKATAGQKNLKISYKLLAWIYPIGRVIFPAGFCTLAEVGRAMINAVGVGCPKQILEVKDIVELAKG